MVLVKAVAKLRSTDPTPADPQTTRWRNRMTAGHVIDMRVGQQNRRESDSFPRDERQQAVHLVARIDQDTPPRSRARHDKPVLEEGADRL